MNFIINFFIALFAGKVLFTFLIAVAVIGAVLCFFGGSLDMDTITKMYKEISTFIGKNLATINNFFANVFK